MIIYDNGVYREATPEDMLKFAISEDDEREYWQAIPYDDAVNSEIRKCYSESQEFAILRQREEKPDEYAAYYAYCEECKAYVREKKKSAGGT